ncbi:hypothetical protein PLESTM_000322700 [Pleodorina starrii]|nr:hypothetical protein PLESTM_000322700 [Pleodorina starrii]
MFAAETTQAQYYIGFGSCPRKMQNQSYGNWKMYRPDAQQPGSLTLFLDTLNTRHMADATGTVSPLDFPIGNMYFGYFDTAAVQKYGDLIANKNAYKEASSWYRVTVNGVQQGSVADMKNALSPLNLAPSANFSLKISLNKGAIFPSTSLFKIVISKNCKSESACAAIPDPAVAFGSPQGHVVYSLWTVEQSMIINGKTFANHAWCPVQSALNQDGGCAHRLFILGWMKHANVAAGIDILPPCAAVCTDPRISSETR